MDPLRFDDLRQYLISTHVLIWGVWAAVISSLLSCSTPETERCSVVSYGPGVLTYHTMGWKREPVGTARNAFGYANLRKVWYEEWHYPAAVYVGCFVVGFTAVAVYAGHKLWTHNLVGEQTKEFTAVYWVGPILVGLTLCRIIAAFCYYPADL